MDNSFIKMEQYREKVRELSRLDPSVVLTLNDKSYRLEFTNRAVKKLLEMTGVNLFKDALDSQQFRDPDILAKLFYCGMLKHNPMELEELDDLLTLRHFPYYVSVIGEAIRLMLPQEEPDDSGTEQEQDRMSPVATG